MSMAWEETSVSSSNETIIACRIRREISVDAHHSAVEWEQATAITFCADWQGKQSDPARETEVRVLWTPENIYVRFECRFRTLFFFDDADKDGRRDHLWDRD